MTSEEAEAIRDVLDTVAAGDFETVDGAGFAMIHRAGDLVVTSFATGSVAAYVRISDGTRDLLLAIAEDGGLSSRCIRAVTDGRAPCAVKEISRAMRNADRRVFGILLDGTIATVDKVLHLLDASLGEIAEQHPTTAWARVDYEWRNGAARIGLGSEDRTDPHRPDLPSGGIVRYTARMETHCTMRTGKGIPAAQNMLGGGTVNGPTLTIGPAMSLECRLDALSRLRCIAEGRKALSSLGIG